MSATYQVKSWTHTVPPYPTTLKLGTTSVPAQPAAHHVLVRVHAASLNPVDIQMMNLGPLTPPFLIGSGTKIAARDFSGTVIAASAESGYTVGDAICGIIPDFTGKVGTLSEVVHLDVRAACTIPKPPHLTHVSAASLPLVYLTARTTLDRAAAFMEAISAPAENKVVVLGGSSAVGIYVVKLARQRGWTVLATCSGRNAKFVKQLGADEVVDYTVSDSAVVDAVGAFKPHAIIDCVGGTETIGLAPGYITIVGDKTGRDTMGGSALYWSHPIMLLRWLLGYVNLGNSYDCIILEGRKEWLEEINRLKADEVVIDSTFEFGKTKEAYERLNSGRCRGKVVVEIED